MLRRVLSPSAAERIRAAATFLERVPPGTEAMVVGASRDAADDLARRILAARGAIFGLHRLSLMQLAARCAAADMARVGVAPATSLGVEAVAARVSFEAWRERVIGYFAPVARFPGFARALASTLHELRLAGVGPAAVAAVERSARDVAELLRRFEAQLEDGGVADRAALLGIAARAAWGGALDSMRRMPILLLDVPIEHAATRAFIEAMTAVSPEVLATVPAGDDATVAALAALGAVPHAAPTAGGPGEEPLASSDLGRAREYLFSVGAPPLRDRPGTTSGSVRDPAEPDTAGDVLFFSAPGEGRESVEIARRMLEEAREGTRFDEIAVLLRAPEVHGSLLQVALQRAGIPAYFARGASRPDPAGRAFLALLDCALEGLSARKFAEYLSLGQVPRPDPAGAPPVDRGVWVGPDDELLGPAAEQVARETQAPSPSDLETEAQADRQTEPDADDRPVVDGALRAPWKWEQLLVESAVIGGEDRWRRRLAGLETEYRIRLARFREEEPDSPRLAAIARDLENLEHLRRFAMPVIEHLARLGGSRAWGEWITALEGLAPMVLRRPERVIGVLAALRPLDVIGPVELGEVRGVLANELTTLAERPPAGRHGRVFVGTIEQARGRSFEVVFLPGLAERIFPQKPREDALLLDGLRRSIDAALPTQEERGHRERLLLRLAVGAARRRLHLSYSRIEQTEARPRVPSFYALEVARALTGRVPDPETMARDAAAAADARLAWPAPEDPTRAVDEVEHDLAMLRALLARGPAAQSSRDTAGGPGGTAWRPSTTYGRARYLFELNACLARSLRTRWARWDRRWRPHDGLVRVTDGTRDKLAASRLAARSYSASALQKFAACPYQFFLSAICRLESRTEVAKIIELDPMTRGHLFHRVQADVMRALAADGRVPLESGADRDVARARLDATLDRVAEEYREKLAPAIRRVWQDQVESMRADLRMWLEQSAEGHATWEPMAFELAFGLPRDPGNDPRSVTTEVALPEGYRLRGIVDLVERRRGAPADLRITDYKTGRNFTARHMVVGRGEMLQPVLYALAMEQVLEARAIESRLYYCTRAGGFSERVVPIDAEARSRGVEVLALIDRAVAAGFLPAAPRQRACGICDFTAVCGPHEERRTALKDPARLAELGTLRSWL